MRPGLYRVCIGAVKSSAAPPGARHPGAQGLCTVLVEEAVIREARSQPEVSHMQDRDLAPLFPDVDAVHGLQGHERHYKP